ncbi:MAG: UDP-N-acetylglucosamine 1-carboxyvinyltransferase [Bifidobacteriaceae bacterium]|jgi:UDP-N-acetylglucosamine 1-carboxyvinyltransferase|nr:UDP-N-acetylglucosamine 1-carboxyvinyltransferase [Bifidobacteriaceae bacterium]
MEKLDFCVPDESDVLHIEGGKPLRGTIVVRGAKNLVSKAMVAALLSELPSELRNVPNIRDVQVVSKLLRMHGARVTYDENEGTVLVEPSHVELPDTQKVREISETSRIPILFCGPLLHRLRKAFIPSLGGDLIGNRPINFHIHALEQFGAVIGERTKQGFYITAPNGLHGAKVNLDYPSVGATEQVLLTAVLADGITELSNAAIEPEIMDLINILQKMGAIISVNTDRVIKIEGVDGLQGYTHTALPDRIETASWAALALATQGNITIQGAVQSDMTTFLNVFRKVGGAFDISDDCIRFYSISDHLNPVALETNVHPGFMTDWQQPMVIALTQADGLSIVHETVYENRFQFVQPLKKMGANIQIYKECLGPTPCRFGAKNFEHSIAISGPTPLVGTNFLVPDIRGGFSHVIAALTASKESSVYGISLIDRGYENFREKLSAVNATFE